jgi:uncharacterized protein (DUF1499 family)
MKRRLSFVFAIVGLAATALVVLVIVQNMLSTKPANLGLQEGRLAPCPASPNCVSTEADDAAHRIEPIAWSGSTDAALGAIRGALLKMPRTQVVSAEGNYLHAEARSFLFRFVDDVEFLVDPEQKLIHFRSASRVGYSDLGANRARMERFRKLLAGAEREH